MRNASYSIDSRFILVLLVVVGLQLNAQSTSSISGQIMDAETGTPLFLVNVYLANTTLGTTTDRDGYYYLGDLPPGTYDLVIHHIGYELVVKEVIITGTKQLRYFFELTPGVIQGSEVTVSAQRTRVLQRSLQLMRFKREFIGETLNASQCEILNPEVLEFEIDPDTREFIASSDQVLELENQALGYMIHVIIMEFRCQEGTRPEDYSLNYTVLPRFEPLETESRRTREKWERNRLLCYEGSLRHFFAALAGDEGGSGSFRILSGALDMLVLDVGYRISLDELNVALDDATQVIRWDSGTWLRVSYGVENPKQQEFSYIGLPNGYTLFDRFGNCKILNSIDLKGSWAEKRMADALPFDYRPDF